MAKGLHNSTVPLGAGCTMHTHVSARNGHVVPKPRAKHPKQPAGIKNKKTASMLLQELDLILHSNT